MASLNGNDSKKKPTVWSSGDIQLFFEIFQKCEAELT
jgi:hypothetical protein